MMSFTFMDRWGYLLMGLLGFALGASLSAAILKPHFEARIATMQRDQAQAIAAARADDIETLRLTKRRGDALTAQLQTAQTSIQTKTQEVRHALQLQTTGRPCLSGNAVRVLNNAIATDSTDSVPGPAAEPAGARAALATNSDGADEGQATDTDVAQWANTAREQYAVCRARLDALIDFSTAARTTP